jgi:hypothetical protein
MCSSEIWGVMSMGSGAAEVAMLDGTPVSVKKTPRRLFFCIDCRWWVNQSLTPPSKQYTVVRYS